MRLLIIPLLSFSLLASAQTLPQSRGYQFTAKSSSPLTANTAGIWVSSSDGLMRFTTSSGSTSTVATGGSSLTVGTSSPLGGGGLVSLGGSLTLTCTTCVTGVTASGVMSSSGGTAPNITLSGVVPVANGGTASNAALSGSSVMVSNGSAVVQGAAGTSTTLLHGNATGAPTYSAVSLTADVTGLLPNANIANPSATLNTTSPVTGGGTLTLGSSLTLACATCVTGTPSAIGDLLYSTSGGQATTALADVAVGSYLRSGGVAAAPLWSTLTLPNAATTGDILYATGSNAIGRLADVATNQVLLSGGVASAPSFGTVPNAALSNSSITINTTSPVTGGGIVSLGGSLTLACASCVTLSPGSHQTGSINVSSTGEFDGGLLAPSLTTVSGSGTLTLGGASVTADVPGKLAVGTTNAPNRTFQVIGTDGVTPWLSAGSTAGYEVNLGINSNIGYLQSTHPGVGNNVNLQLNPFGGMVGVGNVTPTFQLDVAGTFHASGNATHDGTSTLTGNVGIGTAPGSNPLIVSNGDLIFDFGSGGTTNGGAGRLASNANQTFMASNQYFASSVIKYARTGGSGSITFDTTTGSTAGDIALQTAPSGTVDTTATLTTRATIKRAGGINLPDTNGISASASGTGTIDYSNTTHTFQVSENAGSYDTLVKETATETLTNKTISGSSNTLSNIGNSSLTNSSVTVNSGAGLSGGGAVSLGGSLTLTIDSTVATLTGSQTLTNKTLTSPIINGATAASGNLDFSGSNGTFKFPTGNVTAPVWAGTHTGTYTLGGTPTITNPVINGATSSGSTAFDLSGNTGTFKFPTGNVTGPVWTGTHTGTYTLGGTPTITAPVINGATSSGSTNFDLSGNSGGFSTTTGASTFGGSSNTFTSDLTFTVANHTIKTTAPAATVTGNNLTVNSAVGGVANASNGGAGGTLTMQPGAGGAGSTSGGTGGTGGAGTMQGGNGGAASSSTAAGGGGQLTVKGGNAGSNASGGGGAGGGTLTIAGGDGTGNGNGGSVSIDGGALAGSGSAGNVNLCNTRGTVTIGASGSNTVQINGGITNGFPARVGSNIASADTIAPTKTITHITGTTTINTITAPSSFSYSGGGGCLILIPDGAFTTGVTGNIAIATVAVVSRNLMMCFDNGTNNWYPSY